MDSDVQDDLFSRAQRCMPGGVNSPVRAFQSVGGTPPFILKGQGPYLFDQHGKRYIDYVGAYGPMILGHAHPRVQQAIQRASQDSFGFGAPTPLELALAEYVIYLMPYIERIRMVNSGTEATMTAIRLARGFTGRPKIIKFEGAYHGHSDSLLVKAGSGLLTLGVPSSAGIIPALAEETLVVPYNDFEAIQGIFELHDSSIAGVIVEPVAGNMNCVPPKPGFLAHLRQLCNRYGSLLIFDEVMTGFRVALGGAQALYEVEPDLSCLAKILGGGLPIGALGGKQGIMDYLAPKGPVYQAGTLSGNPICMAAGLATLQELAEHPEYYPYLAQQTQRLLNGLKKLATEAEIPLTTQSVGSLFGVFFHPGPQVSTFNQVMASNLEHFKCFFHAMLQQGIYLAPSAFEAGFLSITHDDQIIQKTLAAAEQAFDLIRSKHLSACLST